MPNPTFIATPPNALGVTSFDPPGSPTYIANNPAGSVTPSSAAVSPTDPTLLDMMATDEALAAEDLALHALIDALEARIVILENPE